MLPRRFYWPMKYTKFEKVTMKIPNKTLIVGSLCLGASLAMSSAQAGELYVLSNISFATLDHTIERSLGASAPTLPAPDAGGTSTVSESEFSLGSGIGFRGNVTDKIFLGVEGFYQSHNVDSRNVNGVLATEIELDASYGARILVGVNVSDDFSLYAHGGFTELDYDIRNSYTFAPPERERSDTESGFSFGVGADYKLTDHFAAYIQHSFTADVDFNGIPEVAGMTGRVNPNELDLNETTVGLRYSF